MAVYVKVLIPAKIAENSQTTQYTASGVTTDRKSTRLNSSH